jgi:hypothetical protein
MKQKEPEALAAALEAHPDYRVLRRLDVTQAWPALGGSEVSQAVVLDTETTGLDPAADEVIELALVKFEYSRATGEIGRVLEVYDGLECAQGAARFGARAVAQDLGDRIRIRDQGRPESARVSVGSGSKGLVSGCRGGGAGGGGRVAQGNRV